jgi:hypothetical protein
MTALTANQVKDLIRRAQERYRYYQIQHENWDAANRRYRTHDMAMWQQAAKEIAPPEWAEIIRVLAQGESYYGGAY